VAPNQCEHAARVSKKIHMTRANLEQTWKWNKAYWYVHNRTNSHGRPVGFKQPARVIRFTKSRDVGVSVPRCRSPDQVRHARNRQSFPADGIALPRVSGGGSLSRGDTFIPREIAVYYQLIARRIRDWAPRRA
jgi:hypothetical protein